MKNLPSLRKSGRTAAFALVCASLGAGLVLLVGGQKAILEIRVSFEGVEIIIDTRSDL
jgi:hypothetical protein